VADRARPAKVYDKQFYAALGCDVRIPLQGIFVDRLTVCPGIPRDIRKHRGVRHGFCEHRFDEALSAETGVVEIPVKESDEGEGKLEVRARIDRMVQRLNGGRKLQQIRGTLLRDGGFTLSIKFPSGKQAARQRVAESQPAAVVRMRSGVDGKRSSRRIYRRLHLFKIFGQRACRPLIDAQGSVALIEIVEVP